MGEKTWIQYEYVLDLSGTLWKHYAYIFSAREYMGNIFHSDIAPQPSDAGDILREKIKKSNYIRRVSSVGNDFIMMARKLIVIGAENIAHVVREDEIRKRRWSPGTGNG